MPSFRKLSDQEVAKLSQRRNNIEELAEYVSYLQTLNDGDWGSIELGEDENQRTVKRRTSIAATSLGRKVRWRTRNSGERQLVFEVKSTQ